MPSGLIFLFVLSVLVVAHEWGHFFMARRVGIRVEKFSIGFGPIIFGRKKGETEFVISLLPLGGFVKLAGESPEEATGKEWEFQSKSPLQKFMVVLAGPLMNAGLAFFIFAAVFCLGFPALTAKIGKVMEGTPAEGAGILQGDRVLAVNGQKVALWEELLREVHEPREEIVLTVDRRGLVRDIPLRPQIHAARDLLGRKVSVSFVGVAPSNEVVYLKSPLPQALVRAAERVWSLTIMILLSLWLMISGALPFKDSVTGPIGIFFMTQQAAQMGVGHLLYFMGSLSVSLFVLNLLPIPVLDGGHLLFLLIERLKGSPLKTAVKERMTQVGLALLLVLMTFVIIQDIQRFSILENIQKIGGHRLHR